MCMRSAQQSDTSRQSHQCNSRPGWKQSISRYRRSAGDLLKYFVLQDKTVDQDSSDIGLSRQKAMMLKIAKVVDDNTLLIDSSLNQEVEFPAKIEIGETSKIASQTSTTSWCCTIAVDFRWAWEPAPDDAILVQVLAWLNQWIRQSTPQSEWKPDGASSDRSRRNRGRRSAQTVISAEALKAVSFELVRTEFFRSSFGFAISRAGPTAMPSMTSAGFSLV